VRQQAQGVLDRLRTGKATKDERGDWQLVTEPFVVKGAVRKRKGSGQPPKTPVDVYMAERWGKVGLKELLLEVRRVFGDESRSEKHAARQLRRFRRNSPLWADIPTGFYDTHLGQCLEPLAAPPIEKSPHVAKKLSTDEKPPSPRGSRKVK